MLCPPTGDSRLNQSACSADIVQEHPISIHAFYGLLKHKQVLSWIARDPSKLGQLHLGGVCFLSSVTEDKAWFSEAAFSASACLLKMWQLEHAGIPDLKEQNDINSLVTVKQCLQEMCEVSCALPLNSCIRLQIAQLVWLAPGHLAHIEFAHQDEEPYCMSVLSLVQMQETCLVLLSELLSHVRHVFLLTMSIKT